MYMIVGLGNPGRKYEHTRHNVGFDTIDRLAEHYDIPMREEKYKGLFGRGIIGSEKVILVKPLTFMNLSGDCVEPLADYYRIPPENVIVIYDDINLDPGIIRVRGKGSAGGHNGIKSLIARLGTEAFPRVRIGVGMKPDQMDLADYVLGHYDQVTQSVMNEAFRDGARAAVTLMEEGVDSAMNHFNGNARKTVAAGSGQAGHKAGREA